MRRACALRGPCTLALAALVLAGCAAFPWPAPDRRAPLPAASNGLLDLRGVVHVHTRGSHDSPGTLGQVIAAARSAGVHWVALTEHPRPPGAVPATGTVEGVLVIPGFEMNAAGGALLLLGVRERPERGTAAADLVRFAHARGGLAFVGHFERSELARPEEYARARPDGLEIVNLHAIALEHPIPLALGLLTLPGPLALRALVRTQRANLERWADLRDVGAIVAGVDAHAKFRLFGPLGGSLDRYRDLFRLVTTHVLAREASERGVLDALRAGRSYVAFEALGPVDAFRFEQRGEGFYLEAPRDCRLALVCDGRETARADASRALLAAPQGARRCRAEAWLGRRLWIVTSERKL